MANESVIRAVDDLIAKGRVQRELRDEYIQHFENNLQNDLLRGADYTNKTKELANERRAYEDRIRQEQQRLQADRAKLEQWQNSVQGELGKLDVLPEMAAKLAAYEQTLRDYQILDQVSVPTLPKPNYQPTPVEKVIQGHNQQPGGKFMTMQDAGAALRDFALLQSKVSRIQAQHMKLFNEPLEDDLIGHYLDTGEDPEQHWRVKHGVDFKRQQVTEANQEAERARIREEERAKLMKEMALDPSRVVGSPLGKPQGALTPIMERYAQSRATAHSQNQPGGTTPPVGGDFVPPEQKPIMAASRERIAAASQMFAEHFDVNGNPITDRGRQLAKTYSD